MDQGCKKGEKIFMKQAAKLTGFVVTPNDPFYDLARREYNTRFNQFPRFIVFVFKPKWI
jgi:hypothetical protein